MNAVFINTTGGLPGMWAIVEPQFVEDKVRECFTINRFFYTRDSKLTPMTNNGKANNNVRAHACVMFFRRIRHSKAVQNPACS